MLELHHGEEPACLQRYRDNLRRPTQSDDWEKFRNERAAYKELVDTLNLEQLERCVYCECTLKTDTGSSQDKMYHHVEHLAPKSRYPRQALTYTNLALSCSRPGTCGMRKGSKDLPLHPQVGINQHFMLMDNGELHSAGQLDSQIQQAEQTISLLNLNDGELVRRRFNYIRQLKGLGKEVLEELRESYRCRDCGETLYRYMGGT